MIVTIREYDLEEHNSLLQPSKGDDNTSLTLPRCEWTWNGTATEVSQRRNKRFLFRPQAFQQFAKDLFLPIGFPDCLEDPQAYLEYQLWDGLQGLCSYWRGVVATQAVLEAAGVGNANAKAWSAALQWALRDGTGLLAGLGFSYVACNVFDTHVKEFRLFADLINDVGLSLDLLAPLWPTYSLFVLALSTVCKTLCGLAAGATKGRITHHFASKYGGHNMADLTAKESTQETLVNLLGMMGGVWVAHSLQKAPYRITLLIFVGLTLLHVWANYKAVKLLKLATLNPERLQVALQGVIEALGKASLVKDGTLQDHEEDLKNAFQRIPTPLMVDESLWSSTRKLMFPTIHLASPFHTKYFVGCKDAYWNAYSNEPYLIGYSNNQQVHLWLSSPSSRIPSSAATTPSSKLPLQSRVSEELQAYTHALLVQEVWKLSSSSSSSSSLQNNDHEVVLQRTLSQVKRLFLDNNGSLSLVDKLRERGWDVDGRLYLGFLSTSVGLEWTVKLEAQVAPTTSGNGSAKKDN